MKKQFLLLLACLLSAATLRAAAFSSITENYRYAPTGGAKTTRTSFNGCFANWYYNNARSKPDDYVSDGIRSFWMNHAVNDASDKSCYLECTSVEGGIKAVSFNWKQGAAADATDALYLSLQINDEEVDKINAEATSPAITATSYSKNLNIKSNAKFTLYNLSTSPREGSLTNIGRFIVGPITFTPYIYYYNKDVTIGTRQYGYRNQEMLNNTEGEGSLSYSSSDNSIATINNQTGIITPIAIGSVTITCTWSEGASTSYTLHIEDGILAENFSKVKQDKAAENANWQGDLFDWTAIKCRRGDGDTIKLTPRQQATWLANSSGSSSLASASAIEGGIKHLKFKWRLWSGSKNTTTKIAVSYGGNEKTAATQVHESTVTIVENTYDEDFSGTSNAVLKLENVSFTTSTSAAVNNRVVIKDIQITPYLLYTTKQVKLDNRYSGTFTNTDLINNTEGEVNYISSNTAVATINETTGEVTLVAPGITIITASWEGVTTTYTLYYEDVITEDFSNAPTSGVSTSRTSFDGNNFTWHYRNARSKTTDTLKSGVRGFWLSPEASGYETYLETTTEGGIKRVSFDWRQYDPAQNGYQFAMQIRKNSGTQLDELTFVGADSYVNTDQSYSKELAIKRTDSKLTIRNGSTSNGSTAGGKLIIGPITITPYLLYTDKSRHTMRIYDTYTREIINNTAGESGTLSFISSNEAVATVNGSGQVTAVASGTTTITAKFAWSESQYVTTTYEVKVVPANCETFSNEATTSTYAANEESAAGDKATWTARLGGINTGDFTPYVAFIRAPRQGENKEAYLYSSPIEGGIGTMTFDWNLVSGESTTNWDIRIFINGREVKRLGDADLTNAKMAEFASITINGINEPDNFTIRFENHSTISGEYTSGNKARFVIDNISWTSYAGTKTLAENTDNSGWIRSNGGQTRTVAISRSALVGGVWNTLCLPFAISKADDLDDADVQEMTSTSIDGDVLTIGFSALDGDELQAGKPYLVKPTSNKDISGTYSSKQISSIASSVTFGSVTLQGIYSPTLLKANDYSTLFVGTPDGEGNNLFYPSEDASLKGFRAYFKINEAMGAPVRHARFVTNQTDAATGVVSNQQSAVSSKRIENGQLIIIRDGQRYDVLGRKK